MLSEKRTSEHFETELRGKQKFYLYLYQVCPSIEIIDILWFSYTKLNDKEILTYYKSVSPFKPHPCGNDSIFKAHCGFIDSDVFLKYYQERENYLHAIKIVGDPYFICKYTKPREVLEEYTNYFAKLINEPQIKLTKLKKCKVLEQVIIYLLNIRYNMNIDQIMRYIKTRYIMYNNLRVLFAYPIGIDCNDKLCKFE